jgi:hypothetical protein
MRRVTVTLAWLSPVHPRHRNYRGASLWFEVENDKLSTDRRDAEWRSARNGTLQHEVFQGERASVFGEDETLLIKINCRADASPLQEAIRYGLVVSIEVAEELGILVYDEIAVRIRPPVPIPAPGA